ncbi:MAG: hypothetical protein PHR35_00635 [Kiritimatiellae bacterium]|nr:hypothetical protein [Kiritimatiellia bacterium]
MNDTTAPDRAAWIKEAGFGLGLHWTAESLPRGKDRPMPYREAVARFDVQRLVSQCVEAGAGWLLFTVAHASQLLPIPCRTMDAILPGRTCERDLVGELAEALGKHGIRLILYYPSVACDNDPDWQRASGWLYDPASYATRQYDIVTELGERYGSRLAGWWLDNCYDSKLATTTWHHVHPSVRGFSDLYDFPRYAAALRAGHAGRAVTFNFTGTGAWASALGRGIVDYGAGESNNLDRVPYEDQAGEGGSVWHAYVWMDEAREGTGNGWVHSVPGEVGPPRYQDDHVVSYIRYVMRHGGGFTYGVAPYQDELVAESTMTQLRAVGREVRSGVTVRK